MELRDLNNPWVVNVGPIERRAPTTPNSASRDGDLMTHPKPHTHAMHQKSKQKTLQHNDVTMACRPCILYLLLLLLHGYIMRHGVLGYVLHNVRSFQRGRSVFLPPQGASVTGTVYEAAEPEAPKVTLFTKEGCTLCDKVKDVLVDLRETHPHSLSQIDITDQEHSSWYDKYKYDIPILHIEGRYWIKHRTTLDQAREGLEALRNGTFEVPQGEPNASEMER